MVQFCYTRGFTHRGYFHADDVFSSAFLRVLNPNIQLYRVTSVPALLETDVVYDIGDGEFDHHTKPVKTRDDGTPYASFGLLWNKFACLKYSPFVVEYVDKTLVKEIDIADNTGAYSALTNFIYALNDEWVQKGSIESQQDSFEKAVNFALIILGGFIKKAMTVEEYSYEHFSSCVLPNLTDDDIITFGSFVPYPDFEVLGFKFVIVASARCDWVCYALDKDYYFPLELRGLRNSQDLDVPKFVNLQGNFAVFESADAAFNYARGLLSKKVLCKWR